MGARRAARRMFWAGFGPPPADVSPPSPDDPVLLQEWNGRVWVDVAEVAKQDEVDAFLAAGPDW